MTRIVATALALVAAGAALAQPRVDVALIDGTVITADNRNTVAQAIAILEASAAG